MGEWDGKCKNEGEMAQYVHSYALCHYSCIFGAGFARKEEQGRKRAKWHNTYTHTVTPKTVATISNPNSACKACCNHS